MTSVVADIVLNNTEREATDLLEVCRVRGLKLATSESCTGGLLAAVLTSIPGSSDVYERGFVTYSNEAKVEQLGVDAEMLSRFGAVSAEVALAMAHGALRHSRADLVAAITGVAGPGGGTPDKPVGLVYVVAARKRSQPQLSRLFLDNLDRHGIRARSVLEAIHLLKAQAKI